MPLCESLARDCRNTIYMVLFAILALSFCAHAISSTKEISPDANDSIQYSSEEVNTAAALDLKFDLAPFRRGDALNRATPNFERAQHVFKQMIPTANQASRPAPNLAWELYVHAGPGEEAYSRAGGKIVFSEPFLDRYRLEDAELAMLIGHEMAHAICEHERDKLSALLRKNAPYRFQVRDAMEMLGIDFFEGRQDLTHLHLMENIADREGLRLAARAGFNPTAALQFFAKIQQLESYAGMFPPTHDPPELRRMTLQEEQQWLERMPEVLRDSMVNCVP